MRSSASLDARPHTPLSLCAGPRDHLQIADEASILARWTLTKMSRPGRAAPTGSGTGAAFGLDALLVFAGPQTPGIDAAGAACDPLAPLDAPPPHERSLRAGPPLNLRLPDEVRQPRRIAAGAILSGFGSAEPGLVILHSSRANDQMPVHVYLTSVIIAMRSRVEVKDLV